MQARPRRYAIVVGALAALLAFVATVQLRSQAEVERTLADADPTTLAFLIDDLHRANDALAAEIESLTARRDAMQAGGSGAATTELTREASQLAVVEGTVPVHGPGVQISIDAPLTPTDLEDAVNELRRGGAEAVAVNDHRVITGSVIALASGSIAIDGAATRGPWTLVAIGDEARLSTLADAMTRSLRGDPRVRRADYRSDADLEIRATVAPRPFVYGSA
jgi:uncharacterized protein YlxW (UPF0749 family)